MHWTPYISDLCCFHSQKWVDNRFEWIRILTLIHAWGTTEFQKVGHLTYISQYQTLITCQCCCCSNGCWQLQTMAHAILQSKRSCFLIPTGTMVMETSSNNPNEKRHRHISLCCNLSWGWLDLRGLVQCGGPRAHPWQGILVFKDSSTWNHQGGTIY